MALEEYHKANGKAKRYFRNCVSKGIYPYLQVLDDILENTDIISTVDLGVVSIPADQIVGTRTEGRKTAFARNFMPLLGENTEFARKWETLCNAHLQEGIRDPILAYEFLNRFYVQEGNKRVSVLKYFDAVTIPGVTIPQVPIVKGDAKSLSIAAASVLAKVTRDQIMTACDPIFPEYGFARHKGYGTAAHIEALRAFGPCSMHRRTFIRNFHLEEPFGKS